METKIIFIGDLKKRVDRDPYANIYGTKLWKSSQSLLSIVAIKFSPVLKYEPDVISNISKLSMKYGIYIKHNQDNIIDYYQIVKQVLISIATCVEFNQSLDDRQNRYYIFPCLNKLLSDMGIDEFNRAEEKQIVKIEKSLARFVGKFRKRYKFEVKILDKDDEDSDDGKQLGFDDLDKDILFLDNVDNEKLKRVDIEYEGILLLLSFAAGIPSVFSIDGNKKKYYLDAYSQMLVENDPHRYKNRTLTLKVKAVDDPSGMTVAIID